MKDNSDGLLDHINAENTYEGQKSYLWMGRYEHSYFGRGRSLNE